jgi:hypothetical protein
LASGDSSAARVSHTSSSNSDGRPVKTAQLLRTKAEALVKWLDDELAGFHLP